MFLKKLLPLLGVLLSINTLGAAENETPAPFYLWGGSGTTTPIGVTNITLPDGTPKDPSYTFISSSYDQELAYSGFIDGINGVTLTLDGLVNFFDDPGYQEDELIETPHLLRLRDGNPLYHGMAFPLLGNKENDVVINVSPNDITTYFTVGDAVDIIQANTIGGLLGTGENFTGLAGKPNQGDNLMIWTTYGWKTYFYYQDKWQTFGTRNDQSATIVYPDEGVVYIRRSDALTVSFSGSVPFTVQSYRPGSDAKFLMSNPFPIPATLSQLIDTSSNWMSGTILDEIDQVLFWSGTAWQAYYHNGSDWINLTSSEIDDKEVEGGEAFFIVRAANSSLTAGYNKIDIPQ